MKGQYGGCPKEENNHDDVAETVGLRQGTSTTGQGQNIRDGGGEEDKGIGILHRLQKCKMKQLQGGRQYRV